MAFGIALKLAYATVMGPSQTDFPGNGVQQERSRERVSLTSFSLGALGTVWG